MPAVAIAPKLNYCLITSKVVRIPDLANKKYGLLLSDPRIGAQQPVNTFKLLPCGRIIFYNSKVSPPDVASLSPLSVGDLGGLSDKPGTADDIKSRAVPLGL